MGKTQTQGKLGDELPEKVSAKQQFQILKYSGCVVGAFRWEAVCITGPFSGFVCVGGNNKAARLDKLRS